ncbi:MAG: site-specific DNA-methyltransferase [Armatimonadia bacterium]
MIIQNAETSHEVHLGDCRDMTAVGDETVDLIVTSPPYWCIKDYGHPGQIGLEQSYEDYLAALEQVMGECLRVLRPGCRFGLNIGDQYLRASEHGRYRIQPIPADLTLTGRRLGFDFMGNIIWRKISTTNTTGGGAMMGSMYYPKDGHVTYEHEYILLFRKQGNWRKPSVEAREKSKLTKEERSRWFRGVWDDVAPDRQKGHVAMFPVELPRRLIRMYSFWGETVLDPFMGSGTTALAAALEGRNSVGYELNEEFLPLIERKVRQGTETQQPRLMGTDE